MLVLDVNVDKNHHSSLPLEAELQRSHEHYKFKVVLAVVVATSLVKNTLAK